MYRLIAGTAILSRGLRSRRMVAKVIMGGTGALMTLDGFHKSYGRIHQHFGRR